MRESCGLSLPQASQQGAQARRTIADKTDELASKQVTPRRWSKRTEEKEDAQERPHPPDFSLTAHDIPYLIADTRAIVLSPTH